MRKCIWGLEPLDRFQAVALVAWKTDISFGFCLRRPTSKHVPQLNWLSLGVMWWTGLIITILGNAGFAITQLFQKLLLCSCGSKSGVSPIFVFNHSILLSSPASGRATVPLNIVEQTLMKVDVEINSLPVAHSSNTFFLPWAWLKSKWHIPTWYTISVVFWKVNPTWI